MSIGIIGFGFVGDAMYCGLRDRGLEDVIVYDPYKIPESKIEDFKDVSMAFICVPTPMGKGGKMDDAALVDVLDKLAGIEFRGISVIKSTTIPNKITELRKKYSELRIVTNPEFLTQRRAREDFINTQWVLVGGDKDDTQYIAEFYRLLFPEANIVEVGAEAVMMAKYMTNSFFACKVALMNEFYHVWEKLDCGDWQDVIKAFSADTRVGPNHLQVPGPDGDKGFGGKCFSKDLNALMAMAKLFGVPGNVMNGAWESNKTFRENKDWLEIEGAVTGDYEDEDE
jgi:UDPglucose 6-dehydrogenase